MKTILVPTDFSKPAQWATEAAIGIAIKARATVILLHVVEQIIEDSFNVEGQVSTSSHWEEKLFTMKLIQKSKAQLEEARKEAEATGVTVKSELRVGNPFHGIRTIIAEHKVDMIVMGTSGRTRFEEMLVGSTTEKVVRHSKCPVLAIHEEPSSFDFKNIVYATSLTDREKAFASVVQGLQHMYNATVHVVRINTPTVFQPDHIVKKAMDTFVKKIGLQNYTLNSFGDYSEEEGVIHFANQINADVIAMATHGRTGLGQLMMGSIAEEVVNHAKKPVLTYVVPQQ
ncbi:universal stress protein UspA [Cytophagales bacterium WSM2-2]|nr:universal stress protein UspA [Cytophagales bacterium WSM2-2]